MIAVTNKDNSFLGFEFLGKVIYLLVIVYYSNKLIFSTNPLIFLDNVNLLLHESGHLVFMLFGETLNILGGTIVQLLVPSLFVLYFLKRSEILSVGFCLFWLGDNFINVSTYVKDAKNMFLPLVGGGIHDWNLLLNKWNALNYSGLISQSFFLCGLILIILNLILILANLLHNYKL